MKSKFLSIISLFIFLNCNAFAEEILEVQETADFKNLSQISMDIGFTLMAGMAILAQEMNEKGMTDEQIGNLLYDEEKSDELEQKAMCKNKKKMRQHIKKAEGIFLKHPEWKGKTLMIKKGNATTKISLDTDDLRKHLSQCP